MYVPKIVPPYLSREERLDIRYETQRGPDSVNLPPGVTQVSTHVIKTVEKDVRALLDHLENEYTNDELRQAMKRLRKWVGYRV